MFHWICPECGREIPPAVRECPACDPQSKQNSVAPPQPPQVAGETALAAAVPAAPAVLSSQPEQEISPLPDPLLALAEQIRAAHDAERVATEHETASVPAPDLAELAAAVGTAEAPTLEMPVAASASSEKPAHEPDGNCSTAVQQVTAPVALLAAPAVEPAPVPEPAPAPLAEAIPAILPNPVRPAPAAEPPKDATAAPLIGQQPPPVPETPAEKPPSGSWLRLAPLQDYSAAATRGMHPAVPLPKILMPDSGPRMTLPGPLLPPELQRRKDLRVVTMIGRRKRTALPGWLVSVLVMFALLGAGVLAALYLLPASHSTADAKTPAPDPETPAVVEPSHPLAEYVEVTGFRFIMDLNKKSEVHYLVVNHSPAELTDMTVYVTVKAANAKPGQPPLCRFSFRSPGLGPFESKEMISSIEKLSRPVALPDWHDLRAEVELSQ